MSRAMTKLEKLIAELCPDGVEFKKLGDLQSENKIKLGRGRVISKRDLQEDPGAFPVYSSSAIGDGKFGEYGKFDFDEELISWSIDGGGKFFFRPKHKFSVTNVSGFLIVEDKTISAKYLYYALINEWKRKVFNYTVKAHPSVVAREYEIPVPPLEVQEEIVRILDKFTQLEAELEAELEARKKQYSHYRNTLLSFENLNSEGGYDGRRSVKLVSLCAETVCRKKILRTAESRVSIMGRYILITELSQKRRNLS